MPVPGPWQRGNSVNVYKIDVCWVKHRHNYIDVIYIQNMFITYKLGITSRSFKEVNWLKAKVFQVLKQQAAKHTSLKSSSKVMS